ncbi:dolichyl-diphosphooligosaccharide--protein glycosyltransferase subunit 1, putative [Hepatocystis sp. ex Piliocolobus tephrosceles]|nr:dolichyl-diphosphooligosaccharide--protein glycosyltransferase subunit 1, putative [Hepatocystis sp. ex Piliocolobus tephrosceles]
MKILYNFVLYSLLFVFTKGELDIQLFQILVDKDIEYLNIYKNKIKENYMQNNENNLVYEHIHKNIYLKDNHVQIVITACLKSLNIGQFINTFTFLLPYHEAFQATNLHVKDDNNGHELNYKILTKTTDIDKLNINNFNYEFNLLQFQPKIYEIKLNKKLSYLDKTNLTFTYMLGQPYFAFPNNIDFSERQRVLYYCSSNILVPYKIEKDAEVIVNLDFLCKECAIVNITSSSYFFLNGFKKINNKTYVSIKKENMNQTFSLGKKSLFYFILDHNLGFFENVTKNIKISQLGYIYEKEEYYLKNNAAKINKFDRYLLSNYEHDHTLMEYVPNSSMSNVIYSMKSEIKYNIYDYNYFDNLGKIYLIKAKEFYNNEENSFFLIFDLKPRYPLLGGWKTHFYNFFYHNSNIYKHKNQKNYYSYQIDLLPSIKSFYIKKLTINIYLPPYTTKFSINSPPQNSHINIQTTTKKDWLDYFSFRNVIQIKIYNLFPQFEEDYYKNMFVSYEINFYSIIWKPILLILFFFILTLLICFIKKLSFNLNTMKENLIEQTTVEKKKFMKACNQLYNNLSDISDNLIEYAYNLNPQEKVKLKEKLLKAEEKWTDDFIYLTKEFYHNFENKIQKELLQTYIDKCYKYHFVVKHCFDQMLNNSLNVNINEITQAKKKLASFSILLFYNFSLIVLLLC